MSTETLHTLDETEKAESIAYWLWKSQEAEAEGRDRAHVMLQFLALCQPYAIANGKVILCPEAAWKGISPLAKLKAELRILSYRLDLALIYQVNTFRGQSPLSQG